MAESDSYSSSKSITLECPICLEFFTNPRTLPCSHTFCLNCIQGIEYFDVISRKRKVTCPICRKSHPLPAEGFLSIPLLHETLDIAKNMSGFKDFCAGICPKCDNEDQLTRCYHCNYVICSNCVTEHDQESEETQERVNKEWQKFSDHADKLVKAGDEIDKMITNYVTKLDNIVEIIRRSVDNMKSEMRLARKENKVDDEITIAHERMSEMEIIKLLLEKQKDKHLLSKDEIKVIKRFTDSPEKEVNSEYLEQIKFPKMTFFEPKIANFELLHGYEELVELVDNLENEPNAISNETNGQYQERDDNDLSFPSMPDTDNRYT